MLGFISTFYHIYIYKLREEASCATEEKKKKKKRVHTFDNEDTTIKHQVPHYKVDQIPRPKQKT